METNSLSTQQLLDTLENKHVLNNEQVSQIKDYLLNSYKPPISLYIKNLLNIGAFFSALFLIAFILSLLGSLRLIGENAPSLMIWGAIFIGIAFFIHNNNHQDDENSFSNLFNVQFSLIFMMSGKLLFIFGFFMIFDRSHHLNMVNLGWILSFIILLLTLLTYPFYKIFIDRFLSIFALLISVTFTIYHEHHIVLMNLFFIAQVVAMIFFLINNHLKDVLAIVYALVCSLCWMTLFMVIDKTPLTPSLHGLLKPDMVYISMINIGLSLGLMVSIAYVASISKKLELEPLIIAIMGAIALGFLSATGILLALILLVLGRAKYDHFLYILGGLFLGIFLFFYYYSLSLTLAYKSAILVGSGILLLIGSWYVKSKYIQEVK
jgi:hypothetical protein